MFIIISERILNHPVKKVFNAFMDPTVLSRWWGPHGFTNRFETFEFRPGGHWIFDMVDEKGKAYPNHGVFKEIVTDKMITWTRLSQPIFGMEVSFEALDDDRSCFTFRMLMPDERLYNTFMTFAPEKNEENFDRLEQVLNMAT